MMTRIIHTIVLEGEDEEVWPFNKDLRTHIAGLKDQCDKEGKVTMTHEYSKDGKKGSGGLIVKGGKALYNFLMSDDNGKKTA
jgi:hypothetical protein